mgnify:FL=1
MTNEFVPLNAKIVTKEEFEDWFGSENINTLTELILELINSKYSIDQIRKDIKSYG